MIKVGIITISDKVSEGKREDRSGKLIKELISQMGAQVVKQEIVSDERKEIEEKLKELSDILRVDLVLTTGGTGLSPRDNTPEATASVIDKEIPGLTETMRLRGLDFTPFAILSRAKSGIRAKTLIINLPGSPEGAEQSLRTILPAIPHAVEVLRGEAKREQANS
ncbi:MogA/MoaB family molybdenum cofactor biosynthesis protein [bacterium]|nr:MogA/MoaB family molybdenum cofactor biosynthesis protein [bacterium]